MSESTPKRKKNRRKIISVASYPLTWVIALVAHLPLGVLYLLSSLFSLAMAYVFRYRRKVILENLANAFPEKTNREHRRIARGFYRHLGDVVVETVKLYAISDRQILRRCHFPEEGKARLKNHYDKGGSIIGLLGHTGNWEWVPPVTSLNLPYKVVPAYRPPKNKAFDRLLLKIRGRYSDELVPKRLVGRAVIRYQRGKDPFILGLIADQRPRPDTGYRTTFLSQETAVFAGPEKLARSMNLPVYFVALRRKRRGTYEMHTELITENPKGLPEGELSARFIALLEKEIIRAPSDWLWLHRRWKHTRKKDGEQ